MRKRKFRRASDHRDLETVEPDTRFKVCREHALATLLTISAILVRHRTTTFADFLG